MAINQDDSFHLEYRGPVIMKGKPTPMDCWFLTRATSSILGGTSSTGGSGGGGNGSLDSPLLQPATPTAGGATPIPVVAQRAAGHASVSRTSSAGGGGGGAVVGT